MTDCLLITCKQTARVTTKPIHRELLRPGGFAWHPLRAVALAWGHSHPCARGTTRQVQSQKHKKKRKRVYLLSRPAQCVLTEVVIREPREKGECEGWRMYLSMLLYPLPAVMSCLYTRNTSTRDIEPYCTDNMNRQWECMWSHKEPASNPCLVLSKEHMQSTFCTKFFPHVCHKIKHGIAALRLCFPIEDTSSRTIPISPISGGTSN